ncbi:MAG: hypothetical protein LC656_06600 [Sphingomonadales bacterium]|nr:hypothetical protein [Sphingomonadales bacterium]
MRLLLLTSLVILAGCGRNPQPRDSQAAAIAREQEELHAQVRLMKDHDRIVRQAASRRP